MTHILKSLEHRVIKPGLRRLWPWRRKTFGGIRVHYMKHLDGGGSSFGQDYIALFRSFGMPCQERVFEWCAGPGFIGFSLLGHGLCRSLALADINPEAVGACRHTIRTNSLSERVAVYQSDNLASVSAAERWDLVVGNPPHFIDDQIGELRGHDPDWRIHRGFYASVERHLKPGGVIVVQENNRGSTAETFRHMIEAAGLAIIFVHGCASQRTANDQFYYIGVMRRHDAAPAWVLEAQKSKPDAVPTAAA